MRWMLIFFALLTSHAFAQPDVVELDGKHFKGGLYQAGDLYLSGQPVDASAIKQLKDLGVTTIVNLRTASEIEDWSPIKEDLLAADAGIDYVHLPAGGDEHPYSPEQVEMLASILEKAKGPVLLHCRSGHRASHLWAAYLAKNQGMPLAEAVELARKVNFGTTAMEEFLGGRVSYQYLKDGQ